MDKVKILWADDEIELLKPHLIFLKDKGFDVATTTNGADALDLVLEQPFDIVFLDENMPGLTGLETLQKIKENHPHLPVIMITKSEEEYIMEDAIGSKISDYLIKPVNPNQILLSIKKNLNQKDLVSQKTTSNYQKEFREIGMRINDKLSASEWTDLYKKMVYWELELDKSGDSGMFEILQMQKTEANRAFFKFIEANYQDWVTGLGKDVPMLSNRLLREKVFQLVKPNESVFLVVIDNLRYDQWKVIEPLITQLFRIEEELTYYAILPTATTYARNALFSGLMPDEMSRNFPQWWRNEDEDGGKNLFEAQFLEKHLQRSGLNIKFSYHKILNLTEGKKLADQVKSLTHNALNAIVYNFVDMLSHAKTEMEVIKELADDESAYRSLTLSWFEHSPLFEILKKVAETKSKLIITTDHGTVLVKEPIKVIGDRSTNTNLRYKIGKSLSYNANEVMEVAKPEKLKLPKSNLSDKYVFAGENQFFVYPNNYNQFVNYYRNTFQHGGVSLEEVLIPYAVLTPR